MSVLQIKFGSDCEDVKVAIKQNISRFRRAVRKLLKNTNSERHLDLFGDGNCVFKIKTIETEDILFSADDFSVKCDWVSPQCIPIQVDRYFSDGPVEDHANCSQDEPSDQILDILHRLSEVEMAVQKTPGTRLPKVTLPNSSKEVGVVARQTNESSPAPKKDAVTPKKQVDISAGVSVSKPKAMLKTIQTYLTQPKSNPQRSSRLPAKRPLPIKPQTLPTNYNLNLIHLKEIIDAVVAGRDEYSAEFFNNRNTDFNIEPPSAAVTEVTVHEFTDFKRSIMAENSNSEKKSKKRHRPSETGDEDALNESVDIDMSLDVTPRKSHYKKHKVRNLSICNDDFWSQSALDNTSVVEHSSGSKKRSKRA